MLCFGQECQERRECSASGPVDSRIVSSGIAVLPPHPSDESKPPHPSSKLHTSPMPNPLTFVPPPRTSPSTSSATHSLLLNHRTAHPDISFPPSCAGTQYLARRARARGIPPGAPAAQTPPSRRGFVARWSECRSRVRRDVPVGQRWLSR